MGSPFFADSKVYNGLLHELRTKSQLHQDTEIWGGKLCFLPSVICFHALFIIVGLLLFKLFLLLTY